MVSLVEAPLLIAAHERCAALGFPARAFEIGVVTDAGGHVGFGVPHLECHRPVLALDLVLAATQVGVQVLAAAREVLGQRRRKLDRSRRDVPQRANECASLGLVTSSGSSCVSDARTMWPACCRTSESASSDKFEIGPLQPGSDGELRGLETSRRPTRRASAARKWRPSRARRTQWPAARRRRRNAAAPLR